MDTPIQDLESLRQFCRSGERLKFLFFWSHESLSRTEIEKECLSQWYPVTFEVGGVLYLSAEQYMMAEKARLFNDQEGLRKILESKHPGAAKQLGRNVKGFSEEVWKTKRFSIVVEGNLAKFSQNEKLLKFLLNTRNRILAEASPRDCIWGIGLSKDDSQCDNPEAWPGLNLLGFALMEVRSKLM